MDLEDCQHQDSGKRAFKEICFVAYKRHSVERETSAKQRVLLIAILDTADTLSILVDPTWPEFISLEDHSYLEALLQDLKPRAQFDARGLFVQLTALNLGPVVTVEMKSFTDVDNLQNLIPSHFSRLV